MLKPIYGLRLRQIMAKVTVSFTVVGTSGYAPLEQFWGRAVAASDIYALGATLIHLLTGITPADLPLKDSRLQFRDRVSLQANFINWLEKATEFSSENRFQTARSALKELGRLEQETPVFAASGYSGNYCNFQLLEKEKRENNHLKGLSFVDNKKITTANFNRFIQFEEKSNKIEKTSNACLIIKGIAIIVFVVCICLFPFVSQTTNINLFSSWLISSICSASILFLFSLFESSELK
jgi:serine/threonine protein kinase